MDVEEFKRKLADLEMLAKLNRKFLKVDTVTGFFEGDGLTDKQLDSVFAYLAEKGIHILSKEEEARFEKEEPAGEASVSAYFNEGAEPDPLSEHEEQFLEKFLQEMPKEETLDVKEREAFFVRAAKGDTHAKMRLLAHYLPFIIAEAKRLHRSKLDIGDMIQEGTVGLMLSLEEVTLGADPDAHIRDSITKAILDHIRERLDALQRDDYLVHRVNKLEDSLKELLGEDEDKFSVEEIAAFLDMSEDELRDILKLTGDDV